MTTYAERIEIASCGDSNKIRQALDAAIAAMQDVHGYRPCGGCGRAYVDLGKIPTKSAAYEVIASRMKFFNRPGSKYQQVYIGYDNATGKEMAMAEAFAKSLQDAGFHAYADGDGD